MTDVVAPSTAETPSTGNAEPRRPWWLVLPLGAVVGLTIGVAARGWMRLISDDPEFTWSGTLFIVIGIGVFGLVQSIALLLRRSSRTWVMRVARVVGSIGLLPLFVGAGGVMFPTVIGSGLAWARNGWRARSRVLSLGVASIPVVFVTRDMVARFGWSLHSLAGFVGLVAVYSAIARVARPTFAADSRSWRLPVGVVIGVVVFGSLVIGVLMVGLR